MAVNHIGLIVTVGLYIGLGLLDQVLDVGGESVMGVGEHRIVALAGNLEAGVARVIGEIGVVAGAAHHEIGAEPPIEQVVAGIAIEHVGVAVPVALQVGATLQDQVFDIGGERKADGRKDRVVAPVGSLCNLIAGVIDEVCIVAAAASHDVGAGAAVEKIASAVAVEHVVEAVAI